MNNSLNFVQYACTGKSFRTESKNLLMKMSNCIHTSKRKLPTKYKTHKSTNSNEMDNI